MQTEPSVCIESAGLNLWELGKLRLLPTYRTADAWLQTNKIAYCSPWVVATIKHDAVVSPQGEMTELFTSQMSTARKEYLHDV